MDNVVAIVTGGTGFVGSKLVKALLTAGAEVRILSSGIGTRNRIEDLTNKISWLDTSDLSIARAVKDATHFFNFAVVYDRSEFTDALLYEINVELPMRIVSALSSRGGPATCVLGDSFFCKFQADATAQRRYTESKQSLARRLLMFTNDEPESLVRIALLRIEQIYGPGDAFSKVLPHLTRLMLEHAPWIPATHGQQQRDFIHVNDVVSAALKVGLSEWNGIQVVECGTGIATSVKDVLERLKQITNSRSTIGFGNLSPDQSIACSFADTFWLENLGWKAQISLDCGLTELAEDIARRQSFQSTKSSS